MDTTLLLGDIHSFHTSEEFCVYIYFSTLRKDIFLQLVQEECFIISYLAFAFTLQVIPIP
jgi:hypothetical protein